MSYGLQWVEYIFIVREEETENQPGLEMAKGRKRSSY